MKSNKHSSMIANHKKYLEDNDIYISYEIEDRLKNLSKRENEPMKLAVSGLFSSGKSTFLNAMLSDDILPSGNLPITSKITYIRYAKEAQLKLTYDDGREELAAVENIAKYVDQQSAEQIKSINHITLYYPKEILKSIVFVDTPGFNSSNKMDDEITEEILKNVDGILWLTMISNAGKKSEIDILEKYLKQYNQKSICIVNHKDENDDDEVDELIEELKDDNNFSKYFADIIPISAKQALDSRQKDQDNLMEKLVKKISASIEKKIISHIKDEKILECYQDAMKDGLIEFTREHNQIKKSDKNKNISLFQKSNIQSIFNYIKQEIKPKANSALQFSLKNELNNINNEISEHYSYLVRAINELEMILGQFNEYQKVEMNVLKQNASKYVKKIDRNIDSLVEGIALILYNSFDKTTKEEFAPDGERTFWGDTPTGDWIKYDIYNFNEEVANKALCGKEFEIIKEKLSNSLDEMYETVDADISRIEDRLTKNIDQWKVKYIILRNFSPEELDLQDLAYESFEYFCNDFENEVIIFREKILSSSWHLYNSLCDIDILKNACYSAASIWNGSTEKPQYDDMLHNIRIFLNIEYIKNFLDGENSFLSKKIVDIRDILEAIFNDNINLIQEQKKEWTIKYRLLEGN